MQTLEITWVKPAKDIGASIIIANECEQDVVHSNTSILSQIMGELISNSLDAVEDCQSRWVKIVVSYASKELIISVTDSGKPIHQDVSTQMFDPFFTTKSPDSHKGVGLTIARVLCETVGASLHFQPNAENTTFSIKIGDRSL